MSYKNYEKEITIDQGVELVGWLGKHGPLVNTAQLTSSIKTLQAIMHDIDRDEIRFVRLLPAEIERRRLAWEVQNGEARKRKARSDTGQKHKKHKVSSFRFSFVTNEYIADRE